jgi:hypothetical protein
MRRAQQVACTALLLGWGVAWATVTTISALAPDLIGLPWLQVLVGVVIAMWAGMAATLERYVTAAYANKPFYWRMELLKDIAVSVTIGSGGYMLGLWHGASPAIVALGLLLGGYLGVRALSPAAERFLAVVASKNGSPD